MVAWGSGHLLARRGLWDRAQPEMVVPEGEGAQLLNPSDLSNSGALRKGWPVGQWCPVCRG